METDIASTPFGSRPMTLTWLRAQHNTCQVPEGHTVNKWQVYRDLCEGKRVIGVSDRSLAVLNALLSFYPDSELSEENGLVVFPSNRQLSLRAHGMADATLRRHLAVLVDKGLIIRRDSPNGKRYARKATAGNIEEAFGFSLAPLLVRAQEFQQAAERVRAETRALRLLRERITLYRRDIGKLIEAAVEEGVPGDWPGLWRRFRQIVERLPRRAASSDLEPFVTDLAQLRDEIGKILNLHINAENPSGSESQTERQQSDSDSNSTFESEPSPHHTTARVQPIRKPSEPPRGYSLGLVLTACPQIADYAIIGITSWRDLIATAAQVGSYLGISPSAYEDACHIMGPENTAIVIACILEHTQRINSPGGYLRVLTEKARGGEFTVGPMLMAALRANSSAARLAG